jgi:hypothetical protein
LLFYPLPVLSLFQVLLSDYCANSPVDTLEGNLAPEGLFFGDEINDLGNGTAEFTIGDPGMKEHLLYFTDINGCVDTVWCRQRYWPFLLSHFMGWIHCTM